MDVVNTWEIRTAKIVCILITGMSAFMFIMELPNPKDEPLDNVLVKCGVLLMFISTVIGFFRISVKSYNKYILIIACGMFLGFNIMVLGHQLNMFRMPSEQILGPGRTLEHIFIVFPFFALLSLFIFRLWAVFLWLALSLIQPCLLYTSPSPRDRTRSRMPSSA